MSKGGALANSSEYKFFRSNAAQQKVILSELSATGALDKTWLFYDYGPKDQIPLICLPGVSGTAEIFFKQFVALAPKGIRLISIEYPPYYSHDQWVRGFNKFITKLQVPMIHLLGVSLGGFLAQAYARAHPQKVYSMIICNSFISTEYFYKHKPFGGLCAHTLFKWMPEFILKRFLLGCLPQGELHPDIADAVDFVVEQIEKRKVEPLISRLCLNFQLGAIQSFEKWPHFETRMTIIDALDHTVTPSDMHKLVQEFYSNAKYCPIKTGGSFCFLTRADEFNMYIQLHMRNHGLTIDQAAERVDSGPQPIIVPGVRPIVPPRKTPIQEKTPEKEEPEHPVVPPRKNYPSEAE